MAAWDTNKNPSNISKYLYKKTQTDINLCFLWPQSNRLKGRLTMPTKNMEMLTKLRKTQQHFGTIWLV